MVTNVQEGHVSDADYEEARKTFSETELANLTLTVALINTWNRIAITFRKTPGEYVPAQHKAAIATK